MATTKKVERIATMLTQTEKEIIYKFLYDTELDALQKEQTNRSSKLRSQKSFINHKLKHDSYAKLLQKNLEQQMAELSETINELEQFVKNESITSAKNNEVLLNITNPPIDIFDEIDVYYANKQRPEDDIESLKTTATSNANSLLNHLANAEFNPQLCVKFMNEHTNINTEPLVKKLKEQKLI